MQDPPAPGAAPAPRSRFPLPVPAVRSLLGGGGARGAGPGGPAVLHAPAPSPPSRGRPPRPRWTLVARSRPRQDSSAVTSRRRCDRGEAVITERPSTAINKYSMLTPPPSPLSFRPEGTGGTGGTGPIPPSLPPGGAITAPAARMRGPRGGGADITRLCPTGVPPGTGEAVCPPLTNKDTGIRSGGPARSSGGDTAAIPRELGARCPGLAPGRGAGGLGKAARWRWPRPGSARLQARCPELVPVPVPAPVPAAMLVPVGAPQAPAPVQGAGAHGSRGTSMRCR